ncbi:hypothetical protein AB1Y20_001812 [Prymnesium parvum]|uniref:Transmembrane protein 163 n=1 Tax=Prymnesium parvum TaxID=97485 RepID=A0AB34KDI3_PRYPA
MPRLPVVRDCTIVRKLPYDTTYREGPCLGAVLRLNRQARSDFLTQALVPAMRCAFDLADPGQREAMLVSVASAISSVLFWTITLFIHVTSSPSLVCFSLSTFLDVASTFVVVFRFIRKDSLAPTAENAILELRTTVIVSWSFVVLALVSISFSAYALCAGSKPRWSELQVETWLSIPALAIYLVIGMLQLQIGCRLRLNSLTKDGILSVFSSAAGVIELMGATSDIFSTTKHQYEAAWWLDPLLSISLSLAMCLYGCHSLAEEAKLGAKWWSLHFWTRSTNPVSVSRNVPEAIEKGQAKGEATSLAANSRK